MAALGTHLRLGSNQIGGGEAGKAIIEMSLLRPLTC